MNLNVKKTQIVAPNNIFSSLHRRFVLGGVTLDESLFSADGDGKKIVPAGTVIGRVPATKLWGPVTAPAFATVTVQGITLTAKEAGIRGNSLAVVLADPSGASAALSVAVANGVITVSLATNSESAITSTAADVVAAINAHYSASDLVTASGDATSALTAVASTALTGGAGPKVGSDTADMYALLVNEEDVTEGDQMSSAVDIARVHVDRVPSVTNEVKALLPGITWDVV